MKKVLEVCVDSLSSARAAAAGGADRLELCSALVAGGLTPSVELLEQIQENCSLPVRCLMRPRAGDFLYDAEELDLGRLDTQVAEYFNALLLHPISKQFIAAMGDVRMHPMSYRRYMWKFDY